MIKKRITYTDYNGLTRTEDFYFNLTKTELTTMQLDGGGDYSQKIQRVTDAKDQAQIIAVFQDLIKRSYGVKSDDGKRFIKNADVLDAFIQCPAYDILFMELATDDDKASEFVNGVMPADLVAKAADEKMLAAAN